MFNSNNTPFTMPVMPATGGYSDGGAWGDGGWLWIIVVFALLFGWGNNGLGGFGCNNGGGYVATAATQADIQRGFDNSAVISKLDGISNGLCDGFYAMNNSMLTGFNGINTNIMQTGYGIQQAINADTVANMQNTNALQSQLANCCCETIDGEGYASSAAENIIDSLFTTTSTASTTGSVQVYTDVASNYEDVFQKIGEDTAAVAGDAGKDTSVDKVAKVAKYLGVTVEELIED